MKRNSITYRFIIVRVSYESAHNKHNKPMKNLGDIEYKIGDDENTSSDEGEIDNVMNVWILTHYPIMIGLEKT